MACIPCGDAGKWYSAQRTLQRHVSCSYCAAVWAVLPVYLYLDFKYILLLTSWYEVQNFKC